MAHVLEKEQFFLFRSKDIHSKGLVGNFDFSEEDSFDIRVNVTLVRSHKRKITVKNGFYRRYMDVHATFDYLAYGSMDSYDLTFRIVRFPISENTYECIVTNLPENEFPTEKIKMIYFARWAIEGSFRKLKYTIGLSSFHLTTEKDPIDVMNLLCRELIPIRNERQYPRLQTAHFRRPRYFIYRAA